MNLNPKLFDEDVEQLPIRKGFGEGLLEAGVEDESVVGLCSDLTESTQMHLFKNKFPSRFVQIGIGEQNLATVGSGMAAMGKIPFISSYAMFSPGRNWEQIRTTICYNDRNVKIAGSHAGVSVGPDGGTHQAIEDIAITRVIPRMTVIVPCDSIEAKKATLAAAKMVGAVYIRLAREKTAVVTTEETPFKIGSAQVFFAPKSHFGKRVGIVACGGLVYNALRAAKELEEEGIGATVLNLATIKPIDKEAIIKLAKENERIVTVEEHQIAGGMGSAVAEVLSQEYPTPIEFVGVKDLFGQSGTPNELIEHYGMGISHIKEAVKKVLGR
ncbi:MAG: transketolase C-terminal domain-containing protein [Candidatus Paceibacterota bacterium]|jgi:transketolase